MNLNTTTNMITSMTGFVSSTETIKQKNGVDLIITLSLKSLNGRYAEVTCKLPSVLSQLETEIIKLLKQKLIRGTMFVTVHIENPSALVSHVAESSGALAGYLDALKRIQKQFNISGTLEIRDVLKLPDIFQAITSPLDESVINQILETFKILADQLTKERKKEGASLLIDMQQHIRTIREQQKSIQARAPILAQERKKQLIDQLEASLALTPSESRDQQIQFINIQLTRYDINEELVRFASHLNELENILNSKTIEKGKKIDFTLQELVREINTLSSKSNDAELSSNAINVKVALEKIREQAQNIL